MKPTTAKEVAAAQLADDIDRLLDRVLELRPVLDAAAHSARVLERFDKELQALAEHSQRAAVLHIVEQTNVVCAQHRDNLERAFVEAASAAWQSAVPQLARALHEQLAARLSADARPGPFLAAGAAFASGLLGALLGAALAVFMTRGTL